jgi:hypothetical protein
MALSGCEAATVTGELYVVEDSVGIDPSVV